MSETCFSPIFSSLLTLVFFKYFYYWANYVFNTLYMYMVNIIALLLHVHVCTFVFQRWNDKDAGVLFSYTVPCVFNSCVLWYQRKVYKEVLLHSHCRVVYLLVCVHLDWDFWPPDLCPTWRMSKFRYTAQLLSNWYSCQCSQRTDDLVPVDILSYPTLSWKVRVPQFYYQLLLLKSHHTLLICFHIAKWVLNMTFTKMSSIHM